MTDDKKDNTKKAAAKGRQPDKYEIKLDKWIPKPKYTFT